MQKWWNFVVVLRRICDVDRWMNGLPFWWIVGSKKNTNFVKNFISFSPWLTSKKTQNSRCWYRIGIRFPHHRLRQKSITQTAIVLIRHFGFRFVRSYGSFLSYDGVLVAVRLLSSSKTPNLLIPETTCA